MQMTHVTMHIHVHSDSTVISVDVTGNQVVHPGMSDNNTRHSSVI